MKNHACRIVSMASSAVLFLAVAGAAEAKTMDKKFHEQFDAKEGTRLMLMHGDGDVTVTPWNRDVVDVHVRYHAEYSGIGVGGAADFDVEFRHDGRDIIVHGLEKGHTNVGIMVRKELDYTYTIQAPPWVELELDGDDGDVEVTGWRGEIECTLDDGDVALQDIRASSVEVGVQDGDVRIEDLRAELMIDSDDGDITLKDCAVDGCSIKLEDGDLEANDCAGDFLVSVDDGSVDFRRLETKKMRLRGADGNVSLSLVDSKAPLLDIATDDGGVSVELERGTSAEFTIQTDDGGIRVDLEGMTNLTKGEHEVTGTVGDGRGKIRIRTADGNVTLGDGS
jgi:hypothetical protein